MSFYLQIIVRSSRKQVEINKFRKFEAFDAVIAPKDKKVLGISWVVTQKEKEGDTVTKARLCVRGDQEINVDQIQTDSPTVSKFNIRMMLMAAAKERWKVTASDVTSAFLQSTQIQREVYIRPPKEASEKPGYVCCRVGSVNGKLWRVTMGL